MTELIESRAMRHHSVAMNHGEVEHFLKVFYQTYNERASEMEASGAKFSSLTALTNWRNQLLEAIPDHVKNGLLANAELDRAAALRQEAEALERKYGNEQE